MFCFQVRINPDCRRIGVRPACKQHDSNTQWYSWPSEVLNLIKEKWDFLTRGALLLYVHRPLIPPLSGNGANNCIGNSVLASTTLVTVENCSNGDGGGRAKQIVNSFKMQPPTAGSAGANFLFVCFCFYVKTGIPPCSTSVTCHETLILTCILQAWCSNHWWRNIQGRRQLKQSKV